MFNSAGLQARMSGVSKASYMANIHVFIKITMSTLRSHHGHSIIRMAICRTGLWRLKRKSDRLLYRRSSGHGRGAESAKAFLRLRSDNADWVDFAEEAVRCEPPPVLPDVICLPKIAAVGACTTGSDSWVDAEDTRVTAFASESA